MEPLKPCPFCGNLEPSAKLLAMEFVYVECTRCGAHGPMKWGAETAHAAWNHRPTAETPRN